jgi:hypothetical protein
MFLHRSVFQAVTNKTLRLFLFCFILWNSVSAQKILSVDSLQNNESGVYCEKLNSWTQNNGVVFFCTKDYSLSEYKKQLDFFESSKIDSAHPPFLSFILFNEYDNISKNPFLINSGLKDSIISQIECFLVCSNKSNVDRALKMFSQNYFIINQIENHSIYQIGLKGICPKDITYSISLYYDLIYEVFNPQYSTEERVVFLEVQNIKLLNEIELLKTVLKNLEANQNKTNNELNTRIQKMELQKKNHNAKE